MRRLTTIVVLLAGLALGSPAAAQPAGESTARASHSWLWPDHAKLQYAGNLGLASVGLGYSYLGAVLETDLYAGWVPGYIGEPIFTAAIKQTYLPFELRPASPLVIRPLTVGVWASYTFGDDYYLVLPDYYPDPYYSWSTAIRVGLFIGGSLGIEQDLGAFESVSAYYEVGTTDLAANVYRESPAVVGLDGLLNIAFGLKLGF